MRTEQDDTSSQELFLGPMNEIRHPDGSPALGWRTQPAPGAFSIARPIRLAPELLAAKPSSKLDYAANLPAPERAVRGDFPAPGAVFDGRGNPKSSIGANNAAFLSQSLDGGRAAVIRADGRRAMLHIRWVCLTRHWQMGAVWRAYQKLEGGARWQRCGGDFLFDDAGDLVHAGSPDAAPPAGSMEVTACPGELTHYPSSLALVKLRQLRADGWPKRELVSLQTNALGEIEAVFSDGNRAVAGYLARPDREMAIAA